MKTKTKYFHCGEQLQKKLAREIKEVELIVSQVHKRNFRTQKRQLNTDVMLEEVLIYDCTKTFHIL